MSIKVEGTTIKIYQGDSGSVTFYGLKPDMLIYMAVRYPKTNALVMPEKHEVTNIEGEVTFDFEVSDTDDLDIDCTKEFEPLSYGLKQVDTETGEENTILLGENPRYGDKYLFKVYPKKVEGLIPSGN